MKAAGVLSFLGKTAAIATTLLTARKLVSAAGASNFDLQDRVILITGGSRGLGFALSQELGSHGSRIALCARDDAELERARKHLESQQIEAATFVCDITREAEIASLVQRVVERFGRIDVLINNAGIIKVGPVDTFDHSDFETAMSLMFWAPLNLTLAVLPHMRKQRSGHIVNITSIGGRVSVPHLLPYCCAKFALVGFSTGLSAEVSSEGIHVLTVVPGLMRTGSYLNAEFTGSAKDEFAWFAVLGNLPGFSVAADYAASCIRRALEQQRHNCTISLPAKLLAASEALMPELTRTSLRFVSSVLLPNRDEGITTHQGKELDVAFGRLFQLVTSLGKASALRFNE